MMLQCPLGDELGRPGGGDGTRPSRAITARPIAGPFMDTTDQTELPVEHLGIFRAGQYQEELAATETSPLVFRKIVNHDFRLEIQPTFATMPLGPRLLPTSTPSVRRNRAGICRRGLVGNRVWPLLGLSTEDLLLQPRHAGILLFDLPGQFRDPRLLLAEDRFQLPPQLRKPSLLTPNGLFQLLSKLPSLPLPDRFPPNRPGVLSPPKVSLLAKPNHYPISLHALAPHGVIPPRRRPCVQHQIGGP